MIAAEATAPVELRWDRGTLLLESGMPDAALERLPGVLWDPRVERFRAPAHRRSELLAALHAAGRRCEDLTRPACPAPHPWQAPALRPYQAGAVAAWEAAGRRGLVVLPTGAGKTRVAMAAMAASGARTLCVVPTRVLLEQWVRALAEHFPGEIGRYGDGQRDERPLTVATTASALIHAERLGQRFDLLVIDEAHHFGGGAGDEILEMSLAPARLGLTATPPAAPERLLRLDALVGPVVYEAAIDDLAGRWLAPYQVETLRLPLSEGERQAYARERGAFEAFHRVFVRQDPGASWQEFLVAAARSAEGRRAVRGWHRSRELVAFTAAKQRALDRLLAAHARTRLLVFTPDNATAYRVARRHLLIPLTCHAHRDERDEALRRFAAGDLCALVSSQVLNEGLDVPAAEVAILVGGRGGDREFLQRVGRVLRPAEGKQARILLLVSADTYEEGQAERRRGWLAAG
ncbi:MAG: DEAD/DEAH box helicase family protein [Pseudomonadota bacterium]